MKIILSLIMMLMVSGNVMGVDVDSTTLVQIEHLGEQIDSLTEEYKNIKKDIHIHMSIVNSSLQNINNKIQENAMLSNQRDASILEKFDKMDASIGDISDTNNVANGDKICVSYKYVMLSGIGSDYALYMGGVEVSRDKWWVSGAVGNGFMLNGGGKFVDTPHFNFGIGGFMGCNFDNDDCVIVGAEIKFEIFNDCVTNGLSFLIGNGIGFSANIGMVF